MLSGSRVVLTALLLMGSMGCTDPGAGETPPDREPGPEPGRAVLVVGDSLIVGADLPGGLTAELVGRGWAAEVSAAEGSPVGFATQVLDRRGDAAVPDVVVVALGTNPNARLGEFAEEAAALATRLRDMGTGRVLWVTPATADEDDYAEHRAVLDLLAAGGLVEVVPWSEHLDEHPELFAGDDLHLTDDGYRALAAFIAEHVDV